MVLSALLMGQSGDNSGPKGPITTAQPPPRCTVYVVGREHYGYDAHLLVIINNHAELSAYLTRECALVVP